MEVSGRSFEIFALIDDTFRNVLLGVLGIVLAVMAMNPSPFEMASKLLSSMGYRLSAALILVGILPVLTFHTSLYSKIYELVVSTPLDVLLKVSTWLVEFGSFMKGIIALGTLWLTYSLVATIGGSSTVQFFYVYTLVVVGTALLVSFTYLSYRMFSEVSRIHLILPRGETEDFEGTFDLSQTFRRVRRLSNNAFAVLALIIFMFLSMAIFASSGNGALDISFSPTAFVLSLMWMPILGIAFFSMKSYEVGIERFGKYLFDGYDAVIFVTGFEYGDIPRSFSIVSALQNVVGRYGLENVPQNVYFRSLSSDRVAASIASVGLAGEIPYPDSKIYRVDAENKKFAIIESYDALGGIMNLVPPILIPEKSVKHNLTHLHLPKTSALGTFPYSLKLGIYVRNGSIDVEKIIEDVMRSGQLGYSPAVLSHVLNSIRKKMGVEKLKVSVKLEVHDDAILKALWGKTELVSEIRAFIRDLTESGLEEALFYTVCHPDYCDKSDSDSHVTLYIVGYNQELPPGSVEYPLPLVVPILSVRAMKKLLEMADHNKNSLKVAVVALGSIHSNPIIHYFIAHNRWNQKARAIYDLSNVFDFFEFKDGNTIQGLAVKSIGPSQFSITGYDHREKRMVTKFACGRQTENNCFLVGMIPYKFVDFPYSPLSKLVLHLKELMGLNKFKIDFWMLSGAGHPGAVTTLLGALTLPKLLNNFEGGIMMTELCSEEDPAFYIISFPVSKTLKLLKETSEGCPNLGAINACYETFEELVGSFDQEEIRSMKIVGMRVD